MVLKRHRAIFRPSSENIVEENDGLVPPTANQYLAMMQRSLILLLTFFFSSLANAQFGGGDKSTFKAVSQVTGIAPGETFKIALQLNHPDHWHSYYVNPGIPGTSMKVDWELPDGFTASETIFAIPRAIETKSGGLDTVLYGYEGEVVFYYEITAPNELAPGKDLTISGKAGWQICDEGSCVQESGEISLVIKSAAVTVPDAAGAAVFENPPIAKPADGWTFEVVEDEGLFSLTATAPDGILIQEDGIYFFSSDQQVDSQSLQDAEVDGQMIIAYFDRNFGNKDLFIDKGPTLETMSGMLAYQTETGTAAVNVSIPLSASPDAAESPGVDKAPASVVHLETVKATAEDIAAGAELYDVDAKLEIVLPSGIEEKKVTFGSSLFFVFIGGLLLNLMPCVFPVLGLKVMGFVAQAGEDEKKIKIHGLVFGLGLLVTMWILSAVIISLNLNWGEQLSNPIFLGAIIVLLFAMGLNLFGLFEIGTSLTGVGGELQGKKGYSGSFFSGVLTTLIATPCSGPFLGAVMGFALSQPKPIAFAVFTVFALGIASPYIVLSFFPALIKKLPRPGAWMESFKQIMAFLVFATVVFFLKSYLTLVGEEHFNYFLFALTLIGLGAYLYGRWGTPITSKTKRMVTGYALSGLMIFGGLTWAYSVSKKPKDGLAWQEWYPGVIELSRTKKRIVWVDYTADW